MTIRIGVLAASVVLFAVLAGCAHAPTAGPSPSAAKTAKPSPSPSPTQLEQPRSALALTCAQLLPLPQLQAHLVDPVSVKIDETHLPRLLAEIAVLQAGGTQCAWGGEYMTDSTWETGVTLAVLPDASRDFLSWESEPAAPRSVIGSVGDFSGLTCSPGSGWCSGDALVGSYWVGFSVNDVNTTDVNTTDVDAATAKANAVMAIVVAAIRGAAPARSNWTPPSSTLNGRELCVDSSATAASRTAMAGCSWSNPTDGLTVETLPSGSWALPALVSNPPKWTFFGSPAPLAVPGADGAIGACGDGCEAYAALDGGLIMIYRGTISDPAALAVTAGATIAAIRGS
jgi:hypothetical protein